MWCRSRGHGNVRRCIHVGLEAVRDSHSSDLHRVPRKVCVARSRLDLSVAEELPDYWQALPESESSRGKRVPNVVHLGDAAIVVLA